MSPQNSLILTNSKDITSDYLCNKLKEEGVRYVRYNTDLDYSGTTFLYKGNTPQIKWGDNTLTPDQVSSLVFRRPKPIDINSDIDYHTAEHVRSEWSEALEGFLAHINQNLWINHPAMNCMASHKIEQISSAKACGLNVPSTLVTNNPDTAHEFIRSQKNGTIVKPLASGFIERDTNDTLIYTRSFEKKHFKILNLIRECPVMFQSRVPKAFDVRITVLDETMIAVALYGEDNNNLQRLDIRRNNMLDVKYSLIEIPSYVVNSITNFLKLYSLRFGALDFAVTEEEDWFFFEINPNGQWAWLDIYAQAGISKAFAKTLRIKN